MLDNARFCTFYLSNGIFYILIDALTCANMYIEKESE
nr:MAG TPA: hypothetical protein [Caudoviricetes sp.]